MSLNFTINLFPHLLVITNIRPFLNISENKLLVALIRCEPDPLLAMPDPNAPDNQYKTLKTLSEYFDRELVGTIGWAKQIPGKHQFTF